MNQKTCFRDLGEAWQRFRRYDVCKQREAIERNLRMPALMAVGFAAVLGALSAFSDVPTGAKILLTVGAAFLTVLSFCAGVMFEPMVDVLEERELRARYGDAVAAKLLSDD